MSYIFDGSNDRMIGSFNSSYPGSALTIACFFKHTHPGVTDVMVNLGNTAGDVNGSHQLRAAATSSYSAITTDTAAVTSGSSTSNLLGVYNGLWTGFVGVFTETGVAGTSNHRVVYVGDIATTGTANTGSRVTGNAFKHISLGENLSLAGDYDGQLAEVAMWRIALSTANITSYLAGTAASGLSASDLIGYWPLSASSATQSNDGIDVGGDLTVTGATFSADHPTIITSTGIKPRLMLLGVG